MSVVPLLCPGCKDLQSTEAGLAISACCRNGTLAHTHSTHTHTQTRTPHRTPHTARANSVHPQREEGGTRSRKLLVVVGTTATIMCCFAGRTLNSSVPAWVASCPAAAFFAVAAAAASCLQSMDQME